MPLDEWCPKSGLSLRRQECLWNYSQAPFVLFLFCLRSVFSALHPLSPSPYTNCAR